MNSLKLQAPNGYTVTLPCACSYLRTMPREVRTHFL